MIKQFENIFDNDTFNLIDNKSQSLLKESVPTFHTNKAWNLDSIKKNFPVLIADLDKKDPELFNLIKFKIISFLTDKFKDLPRDFYFSNMSYWYISFHYWFPFSYIPWHNDGGYKGGMTIYLSDWDLDDGGYFLYRPTKDKPNTFIGYSPQKNSAAVQIGSIWHATTPSYIRGDQEIRRSIQIFFKD